MKTPNIKLKALTFTLLLLLCSPPSLWLLYKIRSGSTPFRSDWGSPLNIVILILNFALLSNTIYSWIFEKKSPVEAARKTSVLERRIGQGFLLLLVVVVISIVVLFFAERNIDFSK